MGWYAKKIPIRKVGIILGGVVVARIYTNKFKNHCREKI